MKKKILFIVICLLGFIGSVDAANVCTDEQIANARATLSVSQLNNGYTVPIPSLGRTLSSNRVNFYKLTLTNNETGDLKNAFCLNGERSARSNLVYKIDHSINNTLANRAWYKAYQYAVVNKNHSEKYIVAQAAIWILAEYGYNSNFNSRLKAAARDISVSLNCEKHFQELVGYGQLVARNTCSTLRRKENSTNAIIGKLNEEYRKQNGSVSMGDFNDRLYFSIDKAANDYISEDAIYTGGTLYWWVEENGNQRYQGMLAPLTCEEPVPPSGTRYTCTKESTGEVVDYTEDYENCISDPTKTPEACTIELNNRYCSDSPYGVVVQNGDGGAVCSNNPINYGSYYETVDTSKDGNAIEGKGEPEQVVGSYCNLYCLENSAQQIFPGNVRPAVSAGTYIIWPTSEATLSSVYKNQYPLKFSGQKTCYVVMSGEGNPVNRTDIDAVYRNLVSTATNSNRYGNFAGRYYEFSRVNGGCDSIYNNETGACKNSYSSMKQAEANLNNYANSQEYKNALREQQEVNSNNANICSHDRANHIAGGIPCTGDYCTEIDYFCADVNSEACRIIKTQCQQQTASGCNTQTRTLSTASQNAIDRYNSYGQTYENLKSTYESCQNEKNACNAYTNNVNAVVNFANEVKRCATYTPSCSGNSCDMYNFTTNVDLSWGDTEYGRIIPDSELEKYTNYTFVIQGDQTINTVLASQPFNNIKIDTRNLINQVKDVVENRKIIANVSVTYSLPTTGNLLYNYVVKIDETYESQTLRPPENSNYTTVGFSNLPISFDASTTSQYELKLTNIRFGDNGGQYNPNDYSCNYNVTKTIPTNCVCPVGTMHEGKDLSSFIIDKGLTCYDAQNAFCDNTPTTCPDNTSIDLTNCINDYDYFACYDMYCRGDDTTKYCPNKPEVNVSACLNNYSYSYCYNLLCVNSGDPSTDVTDGYKCLNTNGVDGEMDITSCVYTKMAQGITDINAAIRECDALICPLSGLRIIYRTISLENPFPGKNISNKVDEFNDDVKGRFPGANWNDKKLVRNHILTVKRQGILYDGSAIYKGDPLYEFELTPATINAIREYNEQQVSEGGYADFTLDCKLNNSRACVSSFVHNPDLSGLKGGACSNETSSGNFYVCSGDN